MADEFTPDERERFEGLSNIQDEGLRNQLENKFREEIRLRRERQPTKSRPAKEDAPSFTTRVGFTGGDIVKSETSSALERVRKGASALTDFFSSNPGSEVKGEDVD